MDGDAFGFVEGLRRYFAELKDPWVAASCHHLLIDIIAITILAVISGADDRTGEYHPQRQHWKEFCILHENNDA